MHKARRLAQVVRARLEGEPEHGDPLVVEVAEMLLELLDDAPLLELVHLDHRGEQLEVVAGVPCELLEGGDVLREAAAAEAEACAGSAGRGARRGPIPCATSTTSAPTSSHTLAISLMKLMRVERNAFDASLIISAEATSVRTIVASSGA